MFLAFTFVLVLAFTLALASCSVISFEELRTELSVAESANWFFGDYFEIQFSENMNHNSVENKLRLFKDGGIIEYEITWEGNACRIKESGGFKKGIKYKVKIDGSVMTDDGRVYDEQISREFYYGNESGIFKLSCRRPEEMNPAAFEDSGNAQNFEDGPDSGNAPNLEQRIKAPLVLEFNKAVDAAVFEREFTISPYIETKTVYSPDKKTVEIRPAKGWQVNTDYSWNAQNTTSEDGYRLYKNYSGTFFPLEKKKAPELLCVCPALLPEPFDAENAVLLKETPLDDLLEKQPVAFLFDCPMDFEGVQKGVSFDNAVRGYWLKKNSACFVFCPSENYETAGDYVITIANDAADICGLKMTESRNIAFSLKSKFIEAEFYWEGQRLDEGKLNEVYLNNYAPFFLTVVFSEKIDGDALLNIQKKISILSVAPMSNALPFIEEIRIEADRKIEMQWNNFSRSDGACDCIYKISVDGGANSVSDRFGNYIKEDICRYILVR